MAFTIGAGVFNVVGNLIVIPIVEAQLANGAIGAAIVEVATELLLLVGAIALMPRGLLESRLCSVGGRALLAGGCAYLAAATTLQFSLPVAVVVGGGTFGVAALVLRLVRPEEARTWLRRSLRCT